MNEEIPYRLAYKITIVILILIIAYILNFNIVISKMYENTINEYKEEIEFDKEYRNQTINIIHHLIDDKKSKETEVANYENRIR